MAFGPDNISGVGLASALAGCVADGDGDGVALARGPVEFELFESTTQAVPKRNTHKTKISQDNLIF
jgi:hypothetical protein